MNENELSDFILKEFLVPQPETQVETTPDQPVVETKPQPKAEEKAAVESSSETEVSKSTVSPTAESKVNPEEPVEEDLSWDSFISEEPKTSDKDVPKFDFNELGKSIGSEIKSQEDLVKLVTELRQTAESAKTASYKTDPDIPDQLKEAIDLAKSNGDYLTLLDIGKVDYSKVHPVDLFEDEVAESFYDDKGNFNEEEYYDYIDSINEKDKLIRGRQLQRELIAIQNQQKEQIRQKAIAQKNDEIRQIQTALSKLDSIGNFKIKESIKKEMFESFASGNYKNSLFSGKDGKVNWEKVADTYFKARYFDAIQKFNEHVAKRETKRSVIGDLTNSTVGVTTKPETVTKPDSKPSGADLYLQSIKHT